MNRKQLDEIMTAIIEQVAKDNSLSKEEATTFVGVALRRGTDAFVKSVMIPTLAIPTA